MTLNNNILNKLNNFKIFLLDLIPIASNNTPQSDTTTGSSGSSLEYARSDHKHPKSTLYAESEHEHDVDDITGLDSLISDEISGKQDKTDNSLNTTDKTVVGAINQINAGLGLKADATTIANEYIRKSSVNGLINNDGYVVPIVDNLTSTKTDRPLSANQGRILNNTSTNQGRILNELKTKSKDYFYIDTVNAEITYDDDSTETMPLLADIRGVNGILKVAISWDDNYNENGWRPSSVTVRLLRDGTSINSYVLNSDNNWQYKVNVPFDDGQGNSYSYSWSANVRWPGYTSTNTVDGNLCIIKISLDTGEDDDPSVPPLPSDDDDLPTPPTG